MREVASEVLILPLHVVHVSPDQVVLKRGLNEMLVSGSDATALCERLAGLISERLTRSAIVDRFPDTLRPRVETLLSALEARHLVEWDTNLDSGGDNRGGGAGAVDVQDRFYAQLGVAQHALESLTAATVVVYGVNLVSHALVSHLREMRVGTVYVLPDSVLDYGPAEAIARVRDGYNAQESDTTIPDSGTIPDVGTAPNVIVATCDFGPAEVLLCLNRAAVAAGVPFLPAWMEAFTGHVGPLVVPGESACLRCYTLRREANEIRPQVSAALRRHATELDEGREAVAMLPPMPAAVGAVAAMEVAKLVMGAPPNDAVGRSLEVNLVSFAAAARRVLKVPRCPDCSDAARRGAPVVLAGSQIPSAWVGLHAGPR